MRAGDARQATAQAVLGGTADLGVVHGWPAPDADLDRGALVAPSVPGRTPGTEGARPADQRAVVNAAIAWRMKASVAVSAQVPAVSSGSVISAWRNFAWVAGSLPA